jgi:colicin import membrane protein
MKFNTAILLSVIFHVGVIALLMTNFQFSKIEHKQTGEIQPQINARAVSSQKVEQLVKKIKQEKADQQLKEKQRLDDLKKAESEAKKRREDEERKAEDAKKKLLQAEQQRKDEEKKTADLKKKRENEEIERKKKADLEQKRKEEADRKAKAEAEQKRKAKEESDRKRKEAEEKARQQALEKEMQAQMEAQAAELAAAHRQQVMSEVDKFAALIEGKVRRNWIMPEKQGYCIFKVKLSPGGLVIGVTTVEGAPLHCDSGQRAIYKSEPLPVSNDPDVFDQLKSINLTLDNRSEENK